LKICVIGGSGVIGSKLVKYFANKKLDVKYTYLKNKIPDFQGGYKLDITDRKSTLSLLDKIDPDVVIHTAALTNVDLCETNKTLATKINVEGTRNVIDGCKIKNRKLVYVSTSAVFDGKKKQYFENQPTSPLNHYGYTKLVGEKLVANSDLSYLILRTDQPYGWNEKWQHTNSVLRVINAIQSGEILKEITDWYNTPTYDYDFAKATFELLRKKLTGTFHVVGPEFVNRFGWALKIPEVFNLDKNMIKPIKAESLSLPAKRVNVKLSNQKLVQDLGFQMCGIKEGLIKMQEEKNDFMFSLN